MNTDIACSIMMCVYLYIETQWADEGEGRGDCKAEACSG